VQGCLTTAPTCHPRGFSPPRRICHTWFKDQSAPLGCCTGPRSAASPPLASVPVSLRWVTDTTEVGPAHVSLSNLASQVSQPAADHGVRRVSRRGLHLTAHSSCSASSSLSFLTTHRPLEAYVLSVGTLTRSADPASARPDPRTNPCSSHEPTRSVAAQFTRYLAPLAVVVSTLPPLRSASIAMTGASQVIRHIARHDTFAMGVAGLSACRQVVPSRPQGTSERADSSTGPSFRRVFVFEMLPGLVPLRGWDLLRLVRLVHTVLRQWTPAVVFEASLSWTKSKMDEGARRLLPVSFRMGPPALGAGSNLTTAGLKRLRGQAVPATLGVGRSTHRSSGPPEGGIRLVRCGTACTRLAFPGRLSWTHPEGRAAEAGRCVPASLTIHTQKTSGGFQNDLVAQGSVRPSLARARPALASGVVSSLGVSPPRRRSPLAFPAPVLCSRTSLSPPLLRRFSEEIQRSTVGSIASIW